MLKDILAQAWEAMLYNRRRTAITMIGMAWGIATVVLLLAYGAGFSRAIEAIFAQWGTNIIGFFPGRTSEQAGGDKAGVKVRFTLDDVDRVSNTVPGITPHLAACPTRTLPCRTICTPIPGPSTASAPSIRTSSSWTSIRAASSTAPRTQQRAHVCVIGSEAKTKLFSGGWALGETIRLNGVIFTVVGVLTPKMQEGDDDTQPHRSTCPSTP